MEVIEAIDANEVLIENNNSTVKQYVVNKALANLLAGSFAGLTGKVFEYPFDTVKVRLQCQEVGPNVKLMGPYQCLKAIIREEGVRGLYRGLSAPMIGAIMENAVLFVCYGKIQKIIQGHSDEPLSIAQLSAAGAVAGMAVSAVLTPVELIKCKLQMQSNFKGPIDCIVKTIRSTGITGMYKGHAATFARESVGGAAWFGTYEFVCRNISVDGKKESLGPLQLMFAGALSGIAFHTVLFPADVVKSQVQAESLTNSSLKPSYLRRLKHLYLNEGIRGLYRGFGVTLCRATPANAIIFGAYELVYQALVPN